MKRNNILLFIYVRLYNPLQTAQKRQCQNLAGLKLRDLTKQHLQHESLSFYMWIQHFLTLSSRAYQGGGGRRAAPRGFVLIFPPEQRDSLSQRIYHNQVICTSAISEEQWSQEKVLTCKIMNHFRGVFLATVFQDMMRQIQIPQDLKIKRYYSHASHFL